MDKAASSQQQASTSAHSSALEEPELALAAPTGHSPPPRAGEEKHHKQVHLQQQQEASAEQERLRRRTDFSRRSQSSPSSLTKHKFGLRPTPSPPRLIIDHQTGDIVESYPEKPVYLRTYQPLDDHRQPRQLIEPLEPADGPANQGRIANYRRLLHKQHATHQELDNDLSLGEEEEEPLGAGAGSDMQKFPKRIPPPHTGKVYFAPSVSSASHLFHQPPPPAHWLPARPQQHQHQQQSPSPSPSPATSVVAANDQQTSTFKQALNKLTDTKYNPTACTDIAIVPSSAGPGSLQTGNQRTGNQQRLTATQMAKFRPYKNSSRPLIMPLIEHFNLHDLCYLLRIVLVFLLSSSIIYLLVAPLDAQCAHYRPTYTHISLILASVNLISVLVFTLFWYCNGVTRTLYSNLSSSAFIVSIYSILVALNLTLGIIFFFVNTCHLQRIISTPHQLAAVVWDSSPLVSGATNSSGDGPDANSPLLDAHLEGLAVASAIYQPVERRRKTRNPGATQSAGPVPDTLGSLSAPRINNWPQLTRLARRAPYLESGRSQSQLLLQAAGSEQLSRPKDAATTNLDDYQRAGLSPPAPAPLPLASALQSAPPAPLQQQPPPAMSPIEAFWDYLKAHASQLSSSFHQFLLQYDLKFIGALHVLCAVCLQYMAMKVAVVRSFFCTPIDPYD